MPFFLPREALPEDRHERRALLDAYFPSDLVPFDQLVENQWKIATFVPDDPEFYCDRQLEKTLLNWPEPVTIKMLGQYWRLYQNAMLSFSDAWSLLYWSLLFAWWGKNRPKPHQIVLFHVDDHVDQGPPIVAQKEGQFECLFTPEPVNFSNVRSIEQALVRRSINIRSFITLFLHSTPSVEVLHFRPAHTGPTKTCGLECTFELDPVLGQGRQRPIMQQSSQPCDHRYTVASELPDLLEHIEQDALILLHLDCDALNNRYNGDSSWDKYVPSIDLDLPGIKEKIGQLVHQIAPLSEDIFLNVALSPGFFPAEYWRETTAHIFTVAQEVGVVKDDPFAGFLRGTYKEKIWDALLT